MGWSKRMRRPSPAMSVAVMALVVAVAGTAVAGTATISNLSKNDKKQIKKLIRKIGAKQANTRITKRAPQLSVARADFAANAASLGGVPAGAYAQGSDLQPVPYTPLALSPGWVHAASGAGSAPPRAYRDQMGVVHLSGLIARQSGTDGTALTLPAGMRPGFHLEFPVVCDVPGLLFDPEPGSAFIYPGGEVKPINTSDADCTERLSLDGIAFRADN